MRSFSFGKITFRDKKLTFCATSVTKPQDKYITILGIYLAVRQAGWTFNSTTGELKITGTGSAGHLKDHTDIKSVVIEAGITALGINSFCGCSNLSSVTFESGSALETIGDYAFLGTANLKYIFVWKPFQDE